MNKKIVSVILIVGIALMLCLSHVNVIKADGLTVYRTIETSSSDGYVDKQGSTYSTVHDYTTGVVTDDSDSVYIGQSNAGGASPRIYRGFLFFDTSIIPDSATVTGAVLGLYVYNNQSTVDFNVTVQSGQPTYPHDPLQDGDYWYYRYSDDGGSRNTSSLTATGYWNVTLSATGIGWISLTGTTKLCLRSDQDIASDAPSSNSEYIVVYSQEKGASYSPQLYLTYTVPQGGAGSVTIHGPYLETGAVFNGVVNATLFYSSNSSETYTFDGTDASADTVTSVSETMPINCYWNLTSDYTKQRVYTFTEDTYTAEIWLHVANTTTDALNQYYISITDFAGLTNAYVSTVKNVGGNTRTIERQPLDVMNNIPFWLITYNQYTLKLESDNGTFTWNLPADVIATHSYVVTKDMVEEQSTVKNFTVSATRVNGSIINVQYYDPDTSTVSVTSTIKYYANYEWNTAYTQTDEGDNDIDYNWTYAEPTKQYTVYIEVSTVTDDYEWIFALAVPAPSNLFGVSLDFIGNAPFPLNQALGLFIAAVAFGLLSWKDTEIGCIIGLSVTGILCLVGLLDVPVMGIAMGFMIVLFLYLHKGKETLRVPP